MNPFLLENIINSFSFILVILVGLLLALVLYLINAATKKGKETDKTKQSLIMLEKYFNTVSLPCIIIKKDGRIALINDAALQLYNKSREEMDGHFLEAFNIISASKKRTGELEQKLDKNKHYDFNYDIITRDKTIPCTFQVSEISSGKHIRYLITISERDNTQKIQNEQNLLEERINTLENATDLGFWVYNYDNNSTIWSRGLYKLLGAKVNETVPDLSFVSNMEGLKAQKLLMAIKNQESFNDEITLTSYDGTEHIVNLVLKHQSGMNGDVSKSMGIMRDITETNKLLDQNKQSRVLLNEVLNSEEICMVLTDINNAIVSTNDYTLSTLNTTIDKITDKSFEEVFGDPKKLPQDFKQTLNTIFATMVPNNSKDIILWQENPFTVDSDNEFKLFIGINLSASARILHNIELMSSHEKN